MSLSITRCLNVKEIRVVGTEATVLSSDVRNTLTFMITLQTNNRLQAVASAILRDLAISQGATTADCGAGEGTGSLTITAALLLESTAT